MRVMQNPVYIGLLRWNGKTYQGTHPAIIDKETFDKVQELYEQNYTNHTKPARSSALGGLLFCSHCGARYALSRFKRGEKYHEYYECHSRRKVMRTMVKDPNCKNKIWRRDALDGLIFGEIEKLTLDPAEEIRKTKRPDAGEKETALRTELAKIDAQRSRLMDLYALGDFSAEELTAKIAPLAERKERLQDALSALPAPRGGLETDEAVQIITSFGDALKKGNTEQVHDLCSALIEKIEIDEGDVRIFWRFS